MAEGEDQERRQLIEQRFYAFKLIVNTSCALAVLDFLARFVADWRGFNYHGNNAMMDVIIGGFAAAMTYGFGAKLLKKNGK